MAPIPPHRQVDSCQRVFPATPRPGGQVKTKLSIADACVARWAAFGATWFFNATETSRSISLHQRILQQTLRETLDEYRHLAGHLQWATKDDIDPSDPNQRYLGRPIVTYGTSTDPGVELIHASYDRPLSDIVPSTQDRATIKKTWVNSDFPRDEFLPRTKVAFGSSLAEFKDLPAMAVQITKFSCGGWAMGVVISHCLADAACLLKLLHAWAARARRARARRADSEPKISDARILFGLKTRPPKTVAEFTPSLLDQHARLMGSPEPDARHVKLARSLPMHRYDWWATGAPGYPAWATESTDATRPGPEEENLDQFMRLSPSTFPPWLTWDVAAPTEHVQLRFGAHEVANMKQAAQAALQHHMQQQDLDSPPISSFNALLAHLWILINRARQHQNTKDDIYLNITLGLRSRVRPQLPDTFTGSPVLVGHISHRAPDVCSREDLGTVALSIRDMVARFTPEAVTAYLHDAAYEVSPQRLWQTFLGRNHVLATSWARLGAYELDFCGTRPAHVHDNMPRADGMLQVMDVGGEGAKDFEVSLSLERQAMRRLLGDDLLRIYET